MRKRKRLYLCRQLDADEYELGTSKSDYDRNLGWFQNEIATFCAEEWERVTGIRLKPGEMRRINIDVQVID